MGSSASLLGRGFNSSKCKTEAKLAVARIKLLRNRREVQVRQMRRDIAMLLESHQDSTARIRVEHVIREQNIMAANEIIELFCELVVVRLPIIAKQRDCPPDLREAVSSLIFAAPRCSDIPELLRLRDIFEKKYRKDFVSAATHLHPESGVNRTLIEKLSVRTPSGEVKLKIMKEIAKEFRLEWDTTESELELLKPPEGRLQGPGSFVSASDMSMRPPPPPLQEDVLKGDAPPPPSTFRSNVTELRSSKDKGSDDTLQFPDADSAAQAAMELAEQATAAAQAAAYLARQDDDHAASMRSSLDRIKGGGGHEWISAPDQNPAVDLIPRGAQRMPDHIRYPSDDDDDMERPAVGIDSKKVQRRHSYNVQPHPKIKFDDSESDSESDWRHEARRRSVGSQPPPNRPPPPPPAGSTSLPKPAAASRVHPKLPDYDELTARFEALRRSRS